MRNIWRQKKENYMKKLLLFCYLSILSTQQVECVKLQRVILSTNCNPYYSDFWPLVAPLWKAMGLQPTLAFVAHEDCQLDETLGDVIRFKPIDGVSEALQAQACVFYCHLSFRSCMSIPDIDMTPVSFNYYTDTAVLCTDDNDFWSIEASHIKRMTTHAYVLCCC